MSDPVIDRIVKEFAISVPKLKYPVSQVRGTQRTTAAQPTIIDDDPIIAHLVEKGLVGEANWSEEDVKKWLVTAKSVMTGKGWYTIVKRDLATDQVLLKPAEFSKVKGGKSMQMRFSTLVKKVNSGSWGANHPTKGYSGRDSERFGTRGKKDEAAINICCECGNVFESWVHVSGFRCDHCAVKIKESLNEDWKDKFERVWDEAEMDVLWRSKSPEYVISREDWTDKHFEEVNGGYRSKDHAAPDPVLRRLDEMGLVSGPGNIHAGSFKESDPIISFLIAEGVLTTSRPKTKMVAQHGDLVQAFEKLNTETVAQGLPVKIPAAATGWVRRVERNGSVVVDWDKPRVTTVVNRSDARSLKVTQRESVEEAVKLKWVKIPGSSGRIALYKAVLPEGGSYLITITKHTKRTAARDVGAKQQKWQEAMVVYYPPDWAKGSTNYENLTRDAGDAGGHGNPSPMRVGTLAKAKKLVQQHMDKKAESVEEGLRSMLSKAGAWFKGKGAGVKDALRKVAKELSETGRASKILAKAAMGKKITDEEGKFLKDQAKDVLRSLGMGAVVALPGGAALAYVLMKVSPVELRPSAFRESVESLLESLSDDPMTKASMLLILHDMAQGLTAETVTHEGEIVPEVKVKPMRQAVRKAQEAAERDDVEGIMKYMAEFREYALAIEAGE